MSKYAIFYYPEADSDLDVIYSYIAFVLKEKKTAQNLVNRIRKEIRSLGTFPEMNEVVDWEPWSSMGMRKMPVDNYIVYYLVDSLAHEVNIVRIFYGGRDVEQMIADGET